jgi:hypothetical protein
MPQQYQCHRQRRYLVRLIRLLYRFHYHQRQKALRRRRRQLLH